MCSYGTINKIKKFADNYNIYANDHRCFQKDCLSYKVCEFLGVDATSFSQCRNPCKERVIFLIKKLNLNPPERLQKDIACFHLDLLFLNILKKQLKYYVELEIE